MEGTSLTYFVEGYCRHCKCVGVLWQIRLGFGFQGNVINDVNYFSISSSFFLLLLYMLVFDERAKRARRYLIMSMEARDIYLYT